MESVIGTIQEWQTLVAAMIAIVAVIIAWKNVTRTIHNANEQENIDGIENLLH